jgi:hypothetical protein
MKTGLIEDGDGKQYYTISRGKICRKTTADEPGAVAHEREDGKTVYYREYKSAVGQLTNVELVKHEDFGYSWILTIDTDDGQLLIRASEKSRYGSDFAKKLPNLKQFQFHSGSIQISVRAV